MSEDGCLWYVYAVTRGGAGDELPAGLRGVDDGPPAAVPDDGLAAVVSRVPARDFAEEPLRARLTDLAWLERTARGHQRVVDGLLAGGGVLPLRLATVCRDEAGIRRLLTVNHARFTAALDRLDGRAEWGVKVYADPPAPGSARAPAAKPASGRDYLRQRGRQRQAEGGTRREAEDAVRSVHDALVRAAEGARLHPPQDARLSGEPGQNLLNGAYLVRREDGQAFCALAGELAGRLTGLRLSLTGPWAPYSFTADEEAVSR
ncbi:GvpL/GvpF family gas vesicle protein [Streptomyces sp. NBC_01803]|uniref:GvpL/GvpF family gas vesicle protein n=1 Tax=Streptomyces sp. NBC_01803 TaxID=2975946 RepID=UPI002DD9013D|nr:GvpL/GvpF family gas vesicle protein [Streptomyces sp. NBC_01803]WSA46934.1 GvpL/GvpF family gas vesicle protein [Streptomyces sp. NBC_01803]